MHLLTALSLTCDCPVLLLAHPSKSGMSSGDGDGGTRAWSNSARSRLYLQRVFSTSRDNSSTVEEDDPNLRVLSTRKANYGPSGTEIRMRWEQGCFIALDEARTADSGDLVAQATKAERVFMHLVDWHADQKINVSAMVMTGNYAPARFAVHPQSEGVTKRRFEQAMTMLLDARKIEIREFGPPSRRTKTIVRARSDHEE